MFGLFKKKSSHKDIAGDIESPKAETAPKAGVKLTLDDVELLADGLFSKNAHASLFVAQCGGFPIGPLSPDDFSEYWVLALDGEMGNFSDENKSLAAQYRLKEFMDSLRWYAEENFRNHPRKVRVEEIADSIRRKEISANSFEALGFDNVANKLLDVAFRKRGHDLERIVVELAKREDYLKSTFLPLQRSRVNKYGDIDLSDELNEIDGFIDHFFDRKEFDYFYTVSPAALLLNYIDEKLADFKVQDDMPLDGIEFEHWCASQIEAQGWVVSVSKASGDQGVDVVAERDGKRVAIQCKRYRNPIGNKAVQEVFTGAQNVDASDSCVLGTGGFTASAEEIADKTGVFLLDAANIGSFSELFGFKVENAEMHQDAEDFEEQFLTVNFTGLGGGFCGTILRSLIRTSGAEHYGLSEATGEEILARIDQSLGYGQLEVERSSAALLLMILAHSLKSHIFVDEKNLQSLLDGIYYDDIAVLNNKGAAPLMEEIVKHDVLEEVHSFLFSTALEMGPLYCDMLESQLSDIIFGDD